MPNGDEQLWKPRSNPSSLHARMQDHRVTLATGCAKTVKDALVFGTPRQIRLQSSRRVISRTPRQIVDGFNAMFAKGHEH